MLPFWYTLFARHAQEGVPVLSSIADFNWRFGGPVDKTVHERDDGYLVSCMHTHTSIHIYVCMHTHAVISCPYMLLMHAHTCSHACTHMYLWMHTHVVMHAHTNATLQIGDVIFSRPIMYPFSEYGKHLDTNESHPALDFKLPGSETTVWYDAWTSTVAGQGTHEWRQKKENHIDRSVRIHIHLCVCMYTYACTHMHSPKHTCMHWPHTHTDMFVPADLLSSCEVAPSCLSKRFLVALPKP